MIGTFGRHLIAVPLLLLAGCSPDVSKPGVSDDLGKLRGIIELQIPAKSVRWETFGTPEYTGGVPGPTFLITLVAELQADKSWFEEQKDPTGSIYIAPESARTWLSEDLRQILDKDRGGKVDLSNKANCRKFTTTLKKTGEPLEGFVCSRADRILLHLTIWSEQ
ncbi:MULTISPECIES: hypothetical protein [unclassified Duganella]|uniref:hypothetical protein n=1 Tax=unclassified Duganella TaxID=2636909 RepID=UPI00070DE920|nr:MULTISPECIES: hypothetical protein [unclassified Duganella]KRC02739.1 hypothetical protein ASE26_16105 [Duganella sp. Root198D2]